MSAVFPNELTDRIIDYLHDDPAALSACALVCLSWIPAVRYHRFASVLLSPENIYAFRALLQTSPDVASFVSHMNALNDWSPVWYTDALCDVLSSTSNLRRFALNYMALWSDDVHDIFSAFPKSLEHIELNHVYLPTGTVGDLIFLWSQLPHLRCFALTGDTQIDGPEIPEEYTHGGTPLLCATEIRLVSKILHFDVIADWLCAQNVPAQLRALSLMTKTEYIAPITRLLREVGPALEKLEFNLDSSPAVKGLDVLCACDLAQCTNLRELQFSGSVFNESSKGNMFLCISQILSHIRTPSIRTLVFTFWGSNSGNLLWAVAQLDGVAAALLQNRAFKGLERVVVRPSDVYRARVNEEVYASVRGTFKQFEERGILAFAGTKTYRTEWMT